MTTDTDPVLDDALNLFGEADRFLAFAALEKSDDPVKNAVNYAQVAQKAHSAGDIQAMVAFSHAGIQYSLAEAAKVGDSAVAAKLTDIAKIISFNLGANTWPGWGENLEALGRSELLVGLDAARVCLRLVQALDLGAEQRGNAQWLVGAQHLALGQHGEAAAAFQRSAEAYGEGDETPSVGLAEGYLALARQLDPDRPDDAEPFKRIVARLKEDGSEDASFFADQLNTAARVFAAGGADD